MAASVGTRKVETLKDLLEKLGNIAPQRVRIKPPPGKASEEDLLRINERSQRQYELVDGTLVEKMMSYPESLLAMWLGHLLQSFLDEHDLGILAGPDGAMRLMTKLIRVPDLSFVSWARLPVRGEFPRERVSNLAPDLAVEVLSKGNTRAEITRKLKEYFLSGVRLVWLVNPEKRTVAVHTAPDQFVVLTEDQTLDGGDVLPGLQLPLSRIFAQVPRSPGKTAKKRRPNGRQKNGPR